MRQWEVSRNSGMMGSYRERYSERDAEQVGGNSRHGKRRSLTEDAAGGEMRQLESSKTVGRHEASHHPLLSFPVRARTLPLVIRKNIFIH